MCPSAAKALANDPALLVAVQQAFPNRITATDSSQGCIHPFKLLDYEGVSVLLTTAAEPGEDCHACTAMISAYFLKVEGRGRRLVAVHRNGLEFGAYGNPGVVKAIRFGGDDAFSIEQGYGNQGYFNTTLSFFVFRGGKIIPLRDSNLIVGLDNTGGETDSRKRNELNGRVEIDEIRGGIRVTYSGLFGGKRLSGVVEWQRVGFGLQIRGGGQFYQAIARAAG
jgi:hypothetical protein